MITSQSPAGRFLIATPAKCGTTTLEEMTRRHGGGRVSRGGLQLDSFRIATGDGGPRRQHRMCPPAAWGSADRYIMVRNPFARYVSIYMYLLNPANYSKWGSREVLGHTWPGWAKGRQGVDSDPLTFPQFLTFYADSREQYNTPLSNRYRGQFEEARHYRSPWVWLDSLTVLERKLAACAGAAQSEVGVLRLENFWQEMAMLKDRYDLQTLSIKPSIHANRSLMYPKQGAKQGAVPRDAAQVAKKDERWVGFYGGGSGLCSFSVDAPAGCECAVCRLGVVQEALHFGYQPV